MQNKKKEEEKHFLHTTLNGRFRELFNKLPEKKRVQYRNKSETGLLIEKCIDNDFELSLAEYRQFLEFLQKKLADENLAHEKLAKPDNKWKTALDLAQPEKIASDLNSDEYEYITRDELVQKLGKTARDGIRITRNVASYLKNTISKWQCSDLYKKQLYIPLYCQTASRQEEVTDDYLAKWLKNKDIAFLLLLGDVGTGKTTTLEHFAQKQAEDFLKDSQQRRLPLFFPLKRFNKEMDIENALVSFCANYCGMELPEGWHTLEQYIKGKLLLFCFDGFDEMAIRSTPDIVQKNFREITSLSNISGNKVVLSSRSHYFQDEAQLTAMELEIKSGLRITLELFRKKQWNDYLTLYFGDDAERYIKKITSLPGYHDLARHPLLLDMMVRELPKIEEKAKINKYTIVEKYTNTWLRKERGTHTNSADRKIFTEQLAWHLWITQKDSIHHEELTRLISRKMPGLRDFLELEYFDSDIRTASYLSRDTEGNYFYYHQMFADFFLARAIQEQIKKNDSSDFGKTPVSDDVVEFLAAGSGDFEPLFKWLEQVNKIIDEGQDTVENRLMKKNILKILKGTGFDTDLADKLKLIQKKFRNMFMDDAQLRLIARQSMLELDRHNRPVTLLNIFDAYTDTCLQAAGIKQSQHKQARACFENFAWFLFITKKGEVANVEDFLQILPELSGAGDQPTPAEITDIFEKLSCFVRTNRSIYRFVHPLVRGYFLAVVCAREIREGRYARLGTCQMNKEELNFLTIMEPDVTVLQQWFLQLTRDELPLEHDEPWLAGLLATLLYNLRDQFDIEYFQDRVFVQTSDEKRRECISLQGLNLSGAVLEAVDLEGADLRDVDLSGARLCYASFRNADMRGSKLCKANLANADFTGAQLEGADFEGANCDNVTGINR